MADTEREFGVELASVSEARRFVRRTLVAWGADSVEHDAALIITELATNSVIHARTPFTVRLSLDEGALRLGVSDGSGRAPVLKRHGVNATTGRGLSLITAFSDDWGVDLEEDGKTVWCRLQVSDPSIRKKAGPVASEGRSGPASHRPGPGRSVDPHGGTDRPVLRRTA